MKIKKYNEHLIQALLESVLKTSKDFKKLIGELPGDNKIADVIHSWIDEEEDIKTTFNAIDQSDKNDEVSFIPDNQYQRFIEKGEDVSTKTKNKAKIGRMIRQLLKDNNVSFTEQDIEKFVNQFKSVWDFKHGVGRKIEIVKGDDIIKWYNENNYFQRDGTLGNSCMRHPHKSEYMRIYADNPDKVSMIIVKQNDKLMARALLWNLDDGRIYLDRIYVINDSDFDTVYNWALKNIANNSVENMPSHYKGKQGIMRCSLSKANPEYYPYADSMYYLYQEIKDGQLTGSGFTSNDYKDYDPESYEGYLVRVIQATDGGSNIQNYRWSEYQKKWIDSSSAAWSVDVDSWVEEDITVICRFTSDRYLKDNCYYNEIIEDWIPKRRAIEDEKYGWILPNMLKDAIIAYTGKYTNPIEIWLDIESNGPQVTKMIKELKTGGTVDIFKPYRNPLNNVFYSSEFRVQDFSGEPEVNFLCFKAYRLTSSVPDELEFLRFSYRHSWVTELDAEVFGLDVDKTQVSYIAANQYLRSHESSIFNDVLKLVDKSNASQNSKSQRIEIANIIHEYMMAEDSDYLFNNQLELVFEDKDRIEISIQLFDSAYEKIKQIEYDDENIPLEEWIIRAIRRETSRSLVETLKVEKLPIMLKYYKLFVYFFTICRYDRYDASDLLARFLNKFERDDYEKLVKNLANDDYNYNDNCFYLMRRVLGMGIDYEIKSKLIQVMDDFSSKNSIDVGKFRNQFNARNQSIIENLDDLSEKRVTMLKTLIS